MPSGCDVVDTVVGDVFSRHPVSSSAVPISANGASNVRHSCPLPFQSLCMCLAPFPISHSA